MEKKELETVNLNAEEEEIQIDILELLYFYLSKILIIIIGFVVGGLIAGAITYYCITPKYTAETTMYTVSASTDSVVNLSDLNIGTSLSQDYVELIKIRPVFEEVIKDLNLNLEPEDLDKMVDVVNITDTRILKISVTSTDPKMAADIANDMAEVSKKKMSKLMDTPEPNIVETATVPEEKSSPSYTKNIMIGALGVVFVIIVVLTIMFVTDNTLKSADDVEKTFGIMPLTIIPESDIGSLNEEKSVDESTNRNKKNRKKGNKNLKK